MVLSGYTLLDGVDATTFFFGGFEIENSKLKKIRVPKLRFTLPNVCGVLLEIPTTLLKNSKDQFPLWARYIYYYLIIERFLHNDSLFDEMVNMLISYKLLDCIFLSSTIIQNRINYLLLATERSTCSFKALDLVLPVSSTMARNLPSGFNSNSVGGPNSTTFPLSRTNM